MEKKIIKSEITDVTVFLAGAQITRMAKLKAAAGKSDLLLGGLPSTVQPGSIQASAEGAAVLSVEYAINHLKEESVSDTIQSIQDKLKKLERDLAAEEVQLELCSKEAEFFESNMSIGGQENGIKAAELKAVSELFSERMRAVSQVRLETVRKITQLKEEADKLRAQLNGLGRLRPKPVGEVTLRLSSDTERQITISFSYFVPHASWQPVYDIRAKDTASNIVLQFNAKVFQSTGEDWKDIKLTLSTGNPSVSGNIPYMNPWYIDFYQEPRPVQTHFQKARAHKAMAADAMSPAPDERVYAMMSMEEEIAEVQADMTPFVNNAVVTQSATTAEYLIKDTFSAGSGDGGQTVDIISYSLPAKYIHYCIRKLDKEVYLLAVVEDWKHLNLVEGDAGIFFENRYVGKTRIDPKHAEDELSLSLGCDKSVVVTRTRGKDFSEKSFTGANTRITRQWELAVQNLKETPVEIKIIDQLPVALNKQITVDAAEVSGAAVDSGTGIMTWELTVEPAKIRKLPVKFTVTYPKNTRVDVE